MADDDAALHNAVIVKLVGANLLVHFFNGVRGNAEVAGRVAVFNGGKVVAVFKSGSQICTLPFNLRRVSSVSKPLVLYTTGTGSGSLRLSSTAWVKWVGVTRLMLFAPWAISSK